MEGVFTGQRFSLLLPAILFAGCQNFSWPGAKTVSNQGTGTSAPAGIPTSPHVVSVSPADGALQVPVASSIVITFDLAINVSTATMQTTAGACSGSIQVSSTNFTTCLGIASFGWSPDALQLTLSPGAGVANATVYKVLVSSSVMGVNGASLMPFTMATGFTTYGDVWVTKANMPTLHGARAVNVNGKIYVIGADAAGTNAMYDPVTDTWTPKAGLGTTYSEFAMETYNNKIYIFGSIQNSTMVLEYNTLTDTWTNCGGTCTAMPTGRYAHTAVELGGFIYVIGGYNGSFLTTVEKFDPTLYTWVAVASFSSYGSCGAPGGREGPAAVAYGGLIYMMGGVCTPDFITYYAPAYVETYDPIGNIWTQQPVTTSPGGKYIFPGLIGTKIYMNGNSSNTLNEYDILTNTWTVRATAPNAINAGAAVYNNQYYGFNGTASPTAFVYSPP